MPAGVLSRPEVGFEPGGLAALIRAAWGYWHGCMGTQSPPVPVQPMRVQALDNLKGVFIAAIIAIDGVLGYAGYDEWWSYADVQETVLEPETEIILWSSWDRSRCS